ncbi:MFS transporter [Uliginosibacterium aquaticum]|uniref:MFS transporter n=1 Tax=Uliginosibacterium aquaticum TaxID=2731212 RepID=A0ABX2ID91_9RHOO|nr:MFS transporter [Uliginosibacterium aquaticum]NSL54545.1 MFS transporter [Uliginosibacterium aquaticum]
MTNTHQALPPHRLLLLIGALQCIYVLDFMLVLPLGPDLAAALGFQANQVAWLTAAYTTASLLAGLAAMTRLDRFDRRHALLASLTGLTTALLACAASQSFVTLLIARTAAGLFAAPAIASGMTILIDNTPPPQRGSAIARVMGGFALATIAGIPLSLELSARLGWQAPFLCIAGLALALCLSAAGLLPAQRAHLAGPARPAPLRLLMRPAVRAASLLQGINQFTAFLVIPNFAAFYLLNLNFPRGRLGLLYLGGGVVALITMQLAGHACDRRGPRLPIILASLAFSLGLLPFFDVMALPATLCFILFMAGNAARNVSLAATLSLIPAPPERAGFMALLKLVQDLGVALASGFAALVLGNTGGPLKHTAELASLTLFGALLVPILLGRLQRHRSVEAARAPLAASASHQS